MAVQGNVIVFGASGAIGGALVKQVAATYPESTVFAVARKPTGFTEPNVQAITCDVVNESQLAQVISDISAKGELRMAIVAIGLLHGQGLMPEKALKDLSAEKFYQVFQANTVLPALIAKHTLPAMPRQGRTLFAALSARVGSISDNRLGGWYAYRSAKAALNMVIKNAAIEASRRNPESLVVTLHPGTVDSALSEPFQQAVRSDKLFTPTYSAQCLLSVLAGLPANATGRCFAWDGQEIAP